ncbi:MAG: alcohol acetyltransferase [Micrococcaceae bacterium]|nr:alcohol acetyltransferase [Micrococcaceae bacterium]
MTRRNWVRLDNASNIFLAARSETDSKVFRLSAQMDHEVDPQMLQTALDRTYDRYRLYHAVLRRAVFWYYLQDSDLRPYVTADDKPTCAPIYDADRRGLLFRVMHHDERIVLEVFHALSDGTGALWFLTDLVAEYLRVRYPEQQRALENTGPINLVPQSGQVDDGATEHELVTDSFTHYFRGRRDKQPNETPTGPRAGGAAKKVHRVTGTRTPDFRTRAVELTMPAKQVLELARAESISLTMYLTALFFESIRVSSDGSDTTRTLSASVPVNLRQFFPSTSPRNFFATVRVEHTYGHGADDVGSVGRHLDSQFRPKATPEALEKKLRRFIRFEKMPLLRIVPRPLKDVILRGINWASNRGLTVAMSNLGRVNLGEPADSHVQRMAFQVSAVRPQLSVMSHAGLLTATFTSPFIETDHIRAFVRLLTGQGIDVQVAAARVTEAELEQETDT